MNQFPRRPWVIEYTIRAVLNFFENSRRWLANISANKKKFKMIVMGLGGRWFTKKNLKIKILWHCTFKGIVSRDEYLLRIDAEKRGRLFWWGARYHNSVPWSLHGTAHVPISHMFMYKRRWEHLNISWCLKALNCHRHVLKVLGV